MMNEPTHGIKNSKGEWMRNIEGVVVCGPERVMRATSEIMNTEAKLSHGSGDSYEACSLPEKGGEGLRRELIDGVYVAIKKFREQWKESPVSIGFGRDLWELCFGAFSYSETPRLWGLTVILNPEIPTGQFQLMT